MLNVSNHYYLNKSLEHMNTEQEEEEIKYIPEGAKCKSHIGLYRLHYPFTGAQGKICRTDRFLTYSSLGRYFL